MAHKLTEYTSNQLDQSAFQGETIRYPQEPHNLHHMPLQEQIDSNQQQEPKRTKLGKDSQNKSRTQPGLTQTKKEQQIQHKMQLTTKMEDQTPTQQRMNNKQWKYQ